MPSDDELFAVVCAYFSQRHPGIAWDEITIKDTHGKKYRLAIPGEYRQVTNQKKAESDGTDEVDSIIIQLLGDSEVRMTTGMIFQRIEDDFSDTPGVSRRNVQRAIARLMQSGDIVNHREDPKDGKGRGYQLA